MVERGIFDHETGVSWDGAQFTITETDEFGVTTPMNLSGSISAKFKIGSGVKFEFKTSDNTILVPNPTNGIMFFAPIVNFNFRQDVYIFQVILIRPDETKEPLTDFRSWTITKGV